MLHIIYFLFLFLFANTFAFDIKTERVAVTNNSLNAVQGARGAALGGAVLAVPFDLPSLTENPLQILGSEQAAAAFSHVSYFEETSYDGAFLLLPFANLGSLSFAASRFGAGGIPFIKEGDDLPEGDNYNTMSISDWMLTGAWAKRFGKWNFAFSIHLLKRELEQSGLGFRSDLAASYEFSQKFLLAAIIKGWTSSAAKWESGVLEYSRPEGSFAFRFTEPIPYFYGKLSLYFQSANLIGDDFERGYIWENPADWLLSSKLGVEFETNFRLSLRAGLLNAGKLSEWTLGAGLEPTKWLIVDYSFQKHQSLSDVHRISLVLRTYTFIKAK